MMWGDQTYSSHGVYCCLADFVFKVVSLDEPNAMFAGDGSFHLDGALDHAVDYALCHFSLLIVEKDDGCIVFS